MTEFTMVLAKVTGTETASYALGVMSYLTFLSIVGGVMWVFLLVLNTPENSPLLTKGEQRKRRNFDRRTQKLRAAPIPGAAGSSWNRMIESHDTNRLLAWHFIRRRFLYVRLYAWFVAVLIYCTETLFWYEVGGSLSAKELRAQSAPSAAALILIPIVGLTALCLPAWTVNTIRDYVVRRRQPLAWWLLESGGVVTSLEGTTANEPGPLNSGPVVYVAPPGARHRYLPWRLSSKTARKPQDAERRVTYLRAAQLLSSIEAKLTLFLAPRRHAGPSAKMLWNAADGPRLASVLAAKATLLDSGIRGVPVLGIFAWLDDVAEALVFREGPPPEIDPETMSCLRESYSRRRALEMLDLGLRARIRDPVLSLSLVGVVAILLCAIWDSIVGLIGEHPAFTSALLVAIVTAMIAGLVNLLASWIRRRASIAS